MATIEGRGIRKASQIPPLGFYFKILPWAIFPAGVILNAWWLRPIAPFQEKGVESTARATAIGQPCRSI